jgi:hypothetical protein
VFHSGYARHPDDWYQEQPWIVDALLDVERFRGVSWDPACGEGTIPRTMRARGLAAWGSDLHDRGGGIPGLDFFAARHSATNIVSNPPYRLIEEWIRHALQLTTGKVAILARLALLESTSRAGLFAETPLARVWVSRRRLSMPPGGRGIEARGGRMPYAWFVWQHRHRGPPSIGWV